MVNCKPVTTQTCEKRKGESIMTRWNLARCEDNDEVRTFAKETLLRRKEEQPAVHEQAKISLSANRRKIDYQTPNFQNNVFEENPKDLVESLVFSAGD